MSGYEGRIRSLEAEVELKTKELQEAGNSAVND